MLLMTVAVGLLLQSPQDMDMKNWVDRGFDPAQPNAYTVAGTPELARKDAWDVAERHALEDHHGKLRDLAETQVEAGSSGWLPGFVRDRVVTDWTREQMRRVQPKVLDRDMIVRDHGFGRSYQAFLLIDEIATGQLQRRGGLARRLKAEEERFVMKSGAMVGLWGLLALFVMWIDRLTRGYMTKRLYALGTLLALAGPALLVVL